MEREAIVKRIEELKEKMFILAMKDMWSQDDFTTNRKWWTEELELKKQLEKMDKEVIK